MCVCVFVSISSGIIQCWYTYRVLRLWRRLDTVMILSFLYIRFFVILWSSYLIHTQYIRTLDQCYSLRRCVRTQRLTDWLFGERSFFYFGTILLLFLIFILIFLSRLISDNFIFGMNHYCLIKKFLIKTHIGQVSEETVHTCLIQKFYLNRKENYYCV